MKKFITFISFLLFTCVAFAQDNAIPDPEKSNYAIIKDDDGFVNVRKEPNIAAPIVGKIYKYDLFLCESNNVNWWKVERILHNKKNQDYLLDGYVYKTKISVLPNWKSINKKSWEIKVRVNTSSYLSRKHKFFKIDNDTYLIDGKRFWGTDGEIPKTGISSVHISIDNIPVILPVNAYNDLYEPHLETLSFTHGPGNTIYISMNNSDGAGGYTIIWIIKDNKYYDRYIDDSNV